MRNMLGSHPHSLLMSKFRGYTFRLIFNQRFIATINLARKPQMPPTNTICTCYRYTISTLNESPVQSNEKASVGLMDPPAVSGNLLRPGYVIFLRTVLLLQLFLTVVVNSSQDYFSKNLAVIKRITAELFA